MLWTWMIFGTWTGAVAADPDSDDDEQREIDFYDLGVDGQLIAPRMKMRMAAPLPAAESLGATPGGAQDIAYFRDRVEAGEVPLPEVFTPEGLFSEHDLPLSADAPCERLLCTNAKAVAGQLAAQPDVRWLAQLGFASGLTTETFERAPLNLVAVVDKSCSMSGEPIDTVKASLHELVERHLGPEDQLSIVLYGANVATHLEPTPASERGALRAAIDGIAIDGSTNMEAGLVRGFDVARRSRRSFDGTSRVMLFTDERPNTGRTDAEGFMGLARAASEDGIGMTTIGVGVQFGAELAQQVSSVRGGNLFFFPDTGAMRERFHDDFDTMVTELAYDLRVEVQPADGVRISGLYGVPGDAVEWTDDGGLVLEVTTIFLSRDRGGLYVALAPDGPRSQRRLGDEVAEITLGYDPRDGARSVTTTAVALVEPGAGDEGLTRGLALVDEATTLKQATTLHHHDNDQEAAWQLVRALRGRLEAVRDGALEPERELVRQLEGTLAALAGRTGETPPLQSRRDDVTGLPVR